MAKELWKMLKCFKWWMMINYCMMGVNWKLLSCCRLQMSPETIVAFAGKLCVLGRAACCWWVKCVQYLDFVSVFWLFSVFTLRQVYSLTLNQRSTVSINDHCCLDCCGIFITQIRIVDQYYCSDYVCSTHFFIILCYALCHKLDEHVL